MGLRSELQTVLLGITPNVYFQPPPSVQMQYPCIVYARSDRETDHANNKPYKHVKGYEVTVIDTDPDSSLPDQVADLPMCSFQRFFTADNLNHDVYELFF